MELIRRGQPAAGLDRGDIERLYALYAPVVFRLAHKTLSSEGDAWDVVQEVFERMLRQGATFRGQSRPMTWVYRVTTNAAISQIRRRKVRESEGDPGGDEPAVGTEQVEARQWLAKWAECLSDRELAVATLLYIDGLTQAEVADVLQLSRKTVGRDVEALRTKLAAFEALPEGGT